MFEEELIGGGRLGCWYREMVKKQTRKDGGDTWTSVLSQTLVGWWWGSGRKYHWHNTMPLWTHLGLIFAYWAARSGASGSRASVTDGRGCRSSPLKKRASKLIQSKSRRNTNHRVAVLLNVGLDSVFIMRSTASEWLIRAIISICWVKVATVSLGECRASAILALCYGAILKKGWGALPELPVASPPSIFYQAMMLCWH